MAVGDGLRVEDPNRSEAPPMPDTTGRRRIIPPIRLIRRNLKTEPPSGGQFSDSLLLVVR